MTSRRNIPRTGFASILLLTLVAGCGRQADRVLAPEPSARHAGGPTDPAVTTAPPGDTECPVPGYDGPILTFRARGLNYTYPNGGYFVSEDRYIDYEVAVGQNVRIHWSGDASGSCTDVRSSRWALDIEDLFDETPRIDEDTDLSHWSVRSRQRSARLQFSEPGTHLFYVDVEDLLGYRSLGIVRITVTAATQGSSAADDGVATSD